MGSAPTTSTAAAPEGPHLEHLPRKRFGQHFLHDPGVLHRLVEAIAPRPNDPPMVEIGPGLGALTLPLLQRLGRLDVVELDRDVIPRLEDRCRGVGELRIHALDALELDLASLGHPGPLRVVGNLPYNISTPLIFHLLGQAGHIRDMHFLLQKEVVDRLTARPGTGAYGRLGVMVQYRCRAEALFPVGPGAFRPPPKVESAVVRLTPFDRPPHEAQDEALLARLVRQAFTQRRKTLRNALKGLASPEQLEAAGIEPVRRPETVSVEEFVTLANRLTAAC
ncbi:16S rRNA (adenine(1518)-N(6)/adenine(1519)-N(6))-dimethyltransferase RsmA [Ectothiorhodospira mobilis]|uniref:16S rRNA (adenine(1518)-N(6)/adenine(1519)-N(6))- dimethyltransferase RsmA n=1 Tax=Ectothiorhodospira mobilis TaxID=195064 RepID=UPI0015A65D86